MFLSWVFSPHASLFVWVRASLIFRQWRGEPFPTCWIPTAEHGTAVASASDTQGFTAGVVEGEDGTGARKGRGQEFGGKSFTWIFCQFVDAVKADLIVKFDEGGFEGGIDGRR